METGEYETNTLSINNIASIAFRIYEPSPDQSQSFQSSALEIERSFVTKDDSSRTMPIDSEYGFFKS
ncbi:hypothetical protein CDV31_011342 [Fusarium ambrosium]|uniref:Uncharacterized protein n=1 Tax=Fusarium ambrosium TaxID=131363 RepID=A0A428TH98_9HYPO|nr:hypothetical protein CDV31_011342 [Fusarium ambrosium]